jgi:hypothetical protein
MYLFGLFLHHLIKIVNPYEGENLIDPLPFSLTWYFFFFYFFVECAIRTVYAVNNLIAVSTSTMVMISTMPLFSAIIRDVVNVHWWLMCFTVFASLWTYPKGPISIMYFLMYIAAWRHCDSIEIIFICTLNAFNVLLFCVQSRVAPVYLVKLFTISNTIFYIHTYACMISGANYPSFWQSLFALGSLELYPFTVIEYIVSPWVTFIGYCTLNIVCLYKNFNYSWTGLIAMFFRNVGNQMVTMAAAQQDDSATRAARWTPTTGDPENSQGREIVESPPVSPRGLSSVAVTLNDMVNAQSPRGVGPSCVVCLTNPREICISPCRHFCLCKECAKNMGERAKTSNAATFSKCPICSGKVESVFRVYNV